MAAGPSRVAFNRPLAADLRPVRVSWLPVSCSLMASWQHIFSGRPDDSFRPCSSRSTSAAPTCILSSYYRSAPFSLSVNCFSRRTGLPVALALRCFPAAVGTTELLLPASSGTVPVGWVLAGALTSLSAGSSFSGFRHVSLDQFAASSSYSLYAAISPRLVPDRGYFLKSYDRLVVTLSVSYTHLTLPTNREV